MKVLLLTNLLLFSGLFLFCPQLAAMEAEKAISCLAAGIGWEQLTYKEEIPELALISSDTELHNLVLYLEGQKGWRDFFLGARGNIPLSTGESREDWTRAGAFEQSNSLTYRWFRADVHAGYFLHQLLNPYVGVSWSYAEQERSNFDNVSIPGIVEETVTEKVNSFSALLGIQGGFQLAARWSLSYSAEYMLPFYSKTTNTRK